MKFFLFERLADQHTRLSRDFLEQAHLLRVEHQAAAEHHSALAKMYADRIDRIEAEMRMSLHGESSHAQRAEEVGNESLRLKSDSVVNYPSRAAHG